MLPLQLEVELELEVEADVELEDEVELDDEVELAGEIPPCLGKKLTSYGLAVAVPSRIAAIPREGSIATEFVKYLRMMTSFISP